MLKYFSLTEHFIYIILFILWRKITHGLWFRESRFREMEEITVTEDTNRDPGIICPTIQYYLEFVTQDCEHQIPL